MAARLRILLALVPTAALLACATPHPGGLLLGPGGEISLEDTLPAFERAFAAPGPRPDLAWIRYEKEAAAALAKGGAAPNDPGDKLLFKVCAHPPAVLTLVEGFEASASSELNALAADFTSRLGGTPTAVVVFAVARSWAPAFRGDAGGKPVLLFNARAPELATTEERRAVFTRELYRVAHRRRVPDSPSLGPLAEEVYRAGASCLAARLLVPRAPEAAVLGVEERALPKLHGREALIAQELLAGLDSANPNERARFFDAALADPLLPPGSGRFIADRLYQRLADEEGSLPAALKLSPSDFLRRARPALERLANGQ